LFVRTRSYIGCFLFSTYTLAKLYHRTIFNLSPIHLHHSDPVPLGTGFFLLLRDGAKLRKGANQLELTRLKRPAPYASGSASSARSVRRRFDRASSLAPTTGLEGRRERRNGRLAWPAWAPFYDRLRHSHCRCCRGYRLGRSTIGSAGLLGTAQDDGVVGHLDLETVTTRETKLLQRGCRQGYPAVIAELDCGHG
jgi:hypothetical protein